MAAAVLAAWPVDLMGEEVAAPLAWVKRQESFAKLNPGELFEEPEPDGAARTAWLIAIYGYLFVVGLTMPVIQCCHFPRITAALPPALVPSALSCAISCFGLGGVVGNTIGGLVVENFGVAAAFVCDLGLLVLTFLLLFIAPPDPKPDDPPPPAAVKDGPVEEEEEAVEAAVAPAAAVIHSCAELLKNRPYLGILGTTVLSNLFFWPHIPFVQIIAGDMEWMSWTDKDGESFLGCSPAEAGFLASATGYGNLVGCLSCAIHPPRRIGLVFTAGALAGSALLAVAAVREYFVVLAGLFLCNIVRGITALLFPFSPRLSSYFHR
jgi:hypothetical protein